MKNFLKLSGEECFKSLMFYAFMPIYINVMYGKQQKQTLALFIIQPSTSSGYNPACCTAQTQTSTSGVYSMVKRHSLPQNNNDSCTVNKQSDKYRRMLYNMHYHRAVAPPITSYHAQAGQIYYPQSSPLTQAMNNAVAKNREANNQQRNLYIRTPVLHYSTPNMAMPASQCNGSINAAQFSILDSVPSTSTAAFNAVGCPDLPSPSVLGGNPSTVGAEMQVSNENLLLSKNSTSAQDFSLPNGQHIEELVYRGDNYLPPTYKDVKHSGNRQFIVITSGFILIFFFHY